MKTLIHFCLYMLLAMPAMAQDPASLPSGNEDETRMRTSLGIGAVTIDGKTWQQVSLRPEIPIGKLGIALDLTLYFDEEGNLREEDWDEVGDILDKIYYVRWGHKGDPLYIKGGSLDNVTIGYGLLVKRYSNAVEYPQVRRTGFEFDARPGKIQLEGLLANIRELNGPGLLSLRASYPVIGKLRAGAMIAMDGNAYAGIDDQDGDRVPDQLDRYPDADDATQQTSWRTLHDSFPGVVEGLADYPGNDWVLGDLPDYRDTEEDIFAYGVDLGYELLPNLDLYFQYAGFSDYGSGIAPGIRWRPLHWLSAGLEYRDYGDEFIGEFFDRSYDLERTYFSANGDTLYTKEELLRTAPAMSGFYADAHANLFNILNLFAAYTSMKPKEQTILVDGAAIQTVDSNSLRAVAGLNMARIPKLSELSAYYQQTNVEKLFELKTPSALHGVRLGYEMAPGVSLLLHWRTNYQDVNGDHEIKGDEETVRTFLVETMFQLN